MVDASSASQPMSVSTSRPQPVDASTDIVNVFARSELAIGMVMEIHITPDGPELVRIGMMQVRKVPRGTHVTAPRTVGGRKEARADGDWVIDQGVWQRGRSSLGAAVSDPVVRGGRRRRSPLN